MDNIKKTLPLDFSLQKYGLEVRLVNEDDAEFIVSLRNDNHLSKYVHSVGNLQDQIEWTKEYKKREANGLDFYFIYSKNGIPFGLCRIYHIDWARLSYTGGSWLCAPFASFEDSMLTSLITEEIAEALGLIVQLYDVRKENKQVLKFHRKVMCAYEYGETNKDILFMTTPETRLRNKLYKLLGIEKEDIASIPTIEKLFDY